MRGCEFWREQGSRQVSQRRVLTMRICNLARWRVVLVLCAVVCAVGASRLMGQTTATQGTVTVMVLDPSGAVIGDAQLELRDAATNDVRKAVTPAAGSYTFVNLPFGLYSLTVSKQGFQKLVQERVVVQAGRVTDVRAAMKVGTSDVVLEVNGEAAPLIDTTSNAIGATIDLRQIEDLPLQSRDVSA